MRTGGDDGSDDAEGGSELDATAIIEATHAASSRAGASVPVPGRQVAAAVRLDPVLSSVARARALVADVGRRCGLDQDAADDAALVVSELVTNAVLHARTPLDVAVRVEDGIVRLEVTDTSDEPVVDPVPRATPAPVTDVFDDTAGSPDALLDALSSTGRGMELVGALSRQWGVSPRTDGGKTVWAELGAAASPPVGHPTVAPRPEPPASAGRVRLVAVPVRLILESDHQFDDSLRELQVVAMSGSPDVALASLARRAADMRDRLRPIRPGAQHAVRLAGDRGDRLVDIHLDLPEDVAALLDHLRLLLADVGHARRAGQLLVLPPSSEVVEFRRWYSEEVMRQSVGAHLRPCPFPVVRDERQDRSPKGPLSARRLELLRRLRDDLVHAADRPTVASAAVRRVATDVGAAFVNLLFVTPDGTHVDLADRVGYAPDDTRGRRYPVGHDNPISEAVRTAWPIVLRTREERLDRYPDLPVSAPLEANPTGVWIPLGRTAPALGALVVGFARARDFTDTDLHFLLEVGLSIGDRLGELS